MSPSVLAAGALALALAMPVYAVGESDLDAIRKEITDLKSSYEARIQALEKRLKEAEDRAAQAPPAAPPPVSSAPSSSSSSINAFNPAVSAVLQGRYANLSQGTQRRGFSLGESELAIFANIDDKFAGNLIVSLSPEDTVSVEEAYAIYTAAPNGVVPKFGRFFSGVGYLNEQHPHAWDFVDAPLAYQAFLGGQYAQDGIQVKWLAPTEQFVELGAEAGHAVGSEREKNGTDSGAAFVHAGGDIGESHSWRAGVSYLGFDANRVAVADFVWKWAPNGNIRQTNFKVQGEYLQRRDVRQSGWYLQGVYQFMPTWRIGARYDRLDPRALDSFRPERATAMIDWSPSEFSRLRLQFARSKTVADATDNQWFVQYILSMGAHGAHKY